MGIPLPALVGPAVAHFAYEDVALAGSPGAVLNTRERQAEECGTRIHGIEDAVGLFFVVPSGDADCGVPVTFRVAVVDGDDGRKAGKQVAIDDVLDFWPVPLPDDRRKADTVAKAIVADGLQRLHQRNNSHDPAGLGL